MPVSENDASSPGSGSKRLTDLLTAEDKNDFDNASKILE